MTAPHTARRVKRVIRGWPARDRAPLPQAFRALDGPAAPMNPHVGRGTYGARCAPGGACIVHAAGLDEGILLLSLSNSWLYGESLYRTNCGDE